MEGILIKKNDSYLLNVDSLPYAVSNNNLYTQRLSKENCDEIFGIIDVEKLAEEWVFQINGNKWSNNDNTAGDNYGSYKEGFDKAIELNKDKVFTEEQMFRMFLFGHSLSEAIKRGVIEDKPVGEIFNDRIQSLQQPTEIEVAKRKLKTFKTN